MRWPYVLLTILYCAGIWWLSGRPDPPGSSYSLPGLDKVAHAILFGGLAGLVSVGLRRSNPGLGFRPQFWAPVLFAVFYGVVDELHQAFVPDRTPSLGDLVADAAGALLVQSVLCGWVWAATALRKPA